MKKRPGLALFSFLLICYLAIAITFAKLPKRPSEPRPKDAVQVQSTRVMGAGATGSETITFQNVRTIDTNAADRQKLEQCWTLVETLRDRLDVDEGKLAAVPHRQGCRREYSEAQLARDLPRLRRMNQ